MADGAASVLLQRAHSMPLLAHLEELRRRIVFSVAAVLVGFVGCWSYADRIFGLMQRPIIHALVPNHLRQLRRVFSWSSP
jgi:sec-independent protein translocase protein TatC